MVVPLLENDARLAKDGRRPVCIRGMTDLASYPRQRLKKAGTRGKDQTIIPLNGFLEDIRPGIGVVSRNTEREIIETATEHSYRKTAAIAKNALARETIRRQVLKTGGKARELTALRKEERVIPEKKLKDAEDAAASYRTSSGNPVRQRLGQLLNLERLYLLIDGVQVFQKEKGPKGEESRECKVGAILRQYEGRITEMAAWCTWGRIQAFRVLTSAAFLAAAAALNLPAVIVSDGAKWIRNMRKWIPGLARAIWILDWFHLRDHALKCLRVFGIEEAAETATILIGLLWHGKAGEAGRMIRDQTLSRDEMKRNEEEAAVTSFLAYLENQREGIVDYEAYQRQGYIVGSGFVEKLNDTLIKNRMVRGKRMRWGLEGGEAMMALLAARHNGRLAEAFA